MNDQNFEQQSIELSPEELEEIQGAGLFVPAYNFPIGTPNPDWFRPQGPSILDLDVFTRGVPNPDVFRQLRGLR
jgi:hypothetical protein